MADIENSPELEAGATLTINENFDTIKTLLNSIRAQGILNTSDVDKLLTGINTKLEKINTEEDIDLIKIFLSELKQTMDERHSVLVSKFGAIESLFSNLLKNSNELPKSAELKELFDIVATNLTVFSKEVVAQKETLTDITLRLDALRSDDSDKKDIIKNITLLKPDLERLNNGFDSIVLSLNDNFKAIIKTISTIDKTEYLDRFSDNLSNIEMSSNTVLSALQMLDKKAEQVDETLKTVITKDDLTYTNQRIFDLTAQANELNTSVTNLSDRYVRIDNLADKIDASVNIIAGLKAIIEETDDKNTQLLLDDLKTLENEVGKITSDTRFDEFKASLESVLNNLTESSLVLDKNINVSLSELQNIISMIRSLDINASLQALVSKVENADLSVKSHIDDAVGKLSTLTDANVTRVLNDISTSADSLNSIFAQAKSDISNLCENKFSAVFDNIADLKNVVSQIDENGVAANNAVFSSIADRLSVFENTLKNSLENQERSVADSSAKLVERIEDIKNISGILDYKMEASVVDLGNAKRQFEELKSAVDNVLALDFVNTVKDLRVDLYASKQDIMTTIENSGNDLSEKVSNDLYGKYELLISKLDSVEDELKKAQINALAEFRPLLDSIASSIIDVLSYVSEAKTADSESLDGKLNDISNIVKETNMNYVESVRDIVGVVRTQVENDLNRIREDFDRNAEGVKSAVSEVKTQVGNDLNNIKEDFNKDVESLKVSFAETGSNVGQKVDSLNIQMDALKTELQATNLMSKEQSSDLKNDLKFSYSKLLEITDACKELKEVIDSNNSVSVDKYGEIINSAESVKEDFSTKLNVLKGSLLDKISEFKQELANESSDRTNEFKFAVEALSTNSTQGVKDTINELRDLLNKLNTDNSESRNVALTKIIDNFNLLKGYASELKDQATADIDSRVDDILNEFASVKAVLDKVDENVDSDMTRQLSIIESNFETLVAQMNILFEKSDNGLAEKINTEFSNVSDRMSELMAEKLEVYKAKIEETFDTLSGKVQSQTDYLQDRIANLNTALKTIWDQQAADNVAHIDTISDKLKYVLEENLRDAQVDYNDLKDKLNRFVQEVADKNISLTQEFKSQLDDITSYINSVLDVQAQDMASKQNEISDKISSHISELKECVDRSSVSLADIENSIAEKLGALRTFEAENAENQSAILNEYSNKLIEQIEIQKQILTSSKDAFEESLQKECSVITDRMEKETSMLISELIGHFELLKKSQADDVVLLVNKMEEIVSSQVSTNIEDLKSYLDIKTDNTFMSEKLDSLKISLTDTLDGVSKNINRMLDSDAFSNAIADFRLANEMIVNSAVDRMNDRVESFIGENIKSIGGILSEDSKHIEEKLAIFDKKFVDTVTDKFEEIKLLSNNQTSAFEEIQRSVNDILSGFDGINNSLSSKLESISESIRTSLEATNGEIRQLSDCFENLRSQISNKSFDEAFQASINKQVGNLESLINEQLGYIEDINDLCVTNLPELKDITNFLHDTIAVSIDDFANKLDEQDVQGQLSDGLKQLKSDIITQLLNVFNQISFEVEEEEIVDFIQEKHDELIDILSHIVSTTDKINTIKSDIASLNNKINSIISSEGDVDYVYSLQDLESDIANLRVVLNEMKENAEDKVFNELLSSTNNIYNLVESIKNELPSKTDFEGIAEDIVSISTRTNKLILTSEESYKALQDNLQDFKLVINDLDERTRNFAQESGMDKIDSKLNALNQMMQNGARTNQIFNQVFEYLAEWVDTAGNQINDISNRVETLGELGEIKDLLVDMKSNADDAESDELIEALGNVFDKQTKKISSIETKLDKIIVNSTVNKKDKSFINSIEETVNKFLVAMDDKFTKQQEKINLLETKLENIAGLIDEKATAQLTKKVGGMDKQIAKLNKNIEKIASHVVEK